MADKQKVVDVPDLGVIAFPYAMPDEHISSVIKNHLSKTHTDSTNPHLAPVQTEESELDNSVPNAISNHKFPHPPLDNLPANTMPGNEQVPAFLQQGLDMSKVRQVATEPQTAEERVSTAEVSSDDPYKIKVLAPDLYGPPIKNHELTHTYQGTRSPNLKNISAPVPINQRINYDYGGVVGLKNALENHKTVADFNAEQQAEMVKDYKIYHDQYLQKAASGKITPQDEREMYVLQQTYHPFIKQLASMPGTNVNLNRNSLLELLGVQKPVPLGAKVEPPGLPRYDTPGLGVLPADPLMGGKSQATPVPKDRLAQVKAAAAKINPKAQQGLPPQPKDALNQYANPEDRPPKESFAFNKGWSKPGPYSTKLSPQEETEFRKWVAANPQQGLGPAPNFDPLPMADYDVRGHFHAGKIGDPAASLTPNKWDGKIHGNDKFKTPYDGSFSRESMYALPNAPRWVGDRLMTHDGKLVTDETPRKPGGQK
jgi:hypothetical protein